MAGALSMHGFNHELYVRIAVIALLIDVCGSFFRGIHGYPAAKQVSGITLDCDALRRGLGRCSGIYVCDKTSVEYSRQMLFVFWDSLSSCPILAGWS